MKVLMFGWEFPPKMSGGLGTACYDLTKSLSDKGVSISFVMPSAPSADFMETIDSNNYLTNADYIKVDSILTPYMTESEYNSKLALLKNSNVIYGANMGEEVVRFAKSANRIAKEVNHDIIHCHDWMTYEAGINAKKISGKPLVMHIHATEADRTANNPNPMIVNIEKKGLECADIIIANSNWTKSNVIREYKIPASKIKVVHWGIDVSHNPPVSENPFKEKIVLFLGRLTVQKGPDYFIEAAEKVLKHYKNVKFVIAGDGYMLGSIVDRVCKKRMADKFVFTGFLDNNYVHRAFSMADLYVMPSVSEPFGLVALEAMKNRTPIIISKQSGVSEVVKHALKVDFWDTDELANKIVNVLKHDKLHKELKQNISNEITTFNLDNPARNVKLIYEGVING